MRLIDADELLWHFGEVDDNDTKRWDCFITAEEMEEQPTIDAVPVIHGHWIQHGEPPWYVWECSACGKKWFHHWAELEKPNYCSNCGARMDEE